MQSPILRSFVGGLIFSVLASLAGSVTLAQTPALPDRLSDAEFWKLIQDVSEPRGAFPSDNLVSNEWMFQHAIPALERRTKPGHVYLGVGPEQNFTYIAALKPGMAIILDIRRENLHLHLLYKALFELSASRTEFVSRLFSRPLPAAIGTLVSVDSLFSVCHRANADPGLFRKNFQDVSYILLRKHRFALSTNDMARIHFAYEAFFRGGPGLRYSSTMRGLPSYGELMTQSDGHTQRSYLATEANWLFVRNMQLRNLVVPVVGDFAGGKAVRAVADWLRQHNSKVQAFYASNVEHYLFRTEAWRQFYGNVAALPLDESSMFIRYNSAGGPLPNVADSPVMTCSIKSFLLAYSEGRVTNYAQMVAMCR